MGVLSRPRLALSELIRPREPVEKVLSEIPPPSSLSSRPYLDAEAQAALVAAGMNNNGIFSPGTPISPNFPDKTPLRQWDFPAGYNIATRPRSVASRLSFETMDALLSSYDVARTCVEHRVDDIRSLDYRILPADGVEGDVRDDIRAADKFIQSPDGENPFDSWQAMWLDDTLSVDAACIYKLRHKGKVVALQLVDGRTIAPVIDWYGRRPQGGAPAFVQIIQGVPGVWVVAEDVIYHPFRPQTRGPYGLPPIEEIVLLANTDIRFQWHFLLYFTEGTIPDSIAEAPPDQSDSANLLALQQAWGAVMEGDQGAKWKVRWVPSGTNWKELRPASFDSKFPLYLMRRCAAAYKVVPSDMGWTDAVNKASADTQVDVQFRIGTRPLGRHLEATLTRFFQNDMNWRVKFCLDYGGEEEDRLEEAQAHQVYWSIGAESSDEIRSNLLGMPVDPDNPMPRVIFTQRHGPIPIQAVIAAGGTQDPRTLTPTSPPTPEQAAQLQNLEEQGNAVPLVAGGEQTPAQKGPIPSGKVRVELGRTYPESVLGWVDDAAWQLVGAFPLVDVSAARRPGGRDHRKVASMTKALKSGSEMSPVVLVRTPSGNVRVADGYHRVLAYQHAGRVVIPAYVGDVSDEDGPWDDEMHKEKLNKSLYAPLPWDVPDSQERDESEEEPPVLEGVEWRQWQQFARRRALRGKPPEPERGFETHAIPPQKAEAVRKALKQAHSAAEVDDVFAEARRRPVSHPWSHRPKDEARSTSEWAVRMGDRIAEGYAPLIVKALAKSVSGEAVVASLARTAEVRKAQRHRQMRDAEASAAAAAVVAGIGASSVIVAALAALITRLWGESASLGIAAGARQVGPLAATAALRPAQVAAEKVDWESWEVGAADHAASFAKPALSEVLAERGIILKGISNTTVDRIGVIVEEGIRGGKSNEEIAAQIDELISDPARAQLIARTETQRSEQQALSAYYRERGDVAEVEWVTARDARVCPECAANAASGPHALGEPFPSGDLRPPAHPNCRCDTVPVTFNR